MLDDAVSMEAQQRGHLRLASSSDAGGHHDVDRSLPLDRTPTGAGEHSAPVGVAAEPALSGLVATLREQLEHAKLELLCAERIDNFARMQIEVARCQHRVDDIQKQITGLVEGGVE